jgi:Zn-dependent protease
MSATLAAAEAAPSAIHNCPNCSHWLPDGTLACPDCGTLVYGQHLNQLAAEAQQLQSEGKWPEARARWVEALRWLPAGTQQANAVEGQIARIDGKLQSDADQKAKWTKRLGPLAPVAFFLLKFKSALFLLFKLKFLLSLFAFFGIYWALFGWRFALGFTACLFIHEMGHFFPGLGAYVRWYHQGVSMADLSAIALAGPLFGLVAALACLGAAIGLHSGILLVLANVGAWINLFNLLPVLGLDGSQATYALSRLQRGLVAVTSFLFFGLTVSSGGGNLFSPRTQWVFAIVGAGMAYRTFTNDVPEKPSTKTFVWFLGLMLALGFLLIGTQSLVSAITA